MIIPLSGIVVPSAEQFKRLDAFAALARTRAEAVGLYNVIPSPSLDARIAAADCVLVRDYEALLRDGLGLEAAAILAMYRAPHVRLASQRRAA